MKRKLVWYQLPKLTGSGAKRGKQIYSIKIQNKWLCFTYTNAKWYGFSHKCPHQGGPMSAGYLNEAGKIVCPWHRFAFDLENGQSEKGGYILPMYEVKEENGCLWVGIEKRKWWKWWK